MITKTRSTTKITKTTTDRTPKRLTTVFVVFVSLVTFVVLYFGSSWWSSDERAIRNQLTTIATALTVRPNEGDLAPATRLATLRKTLAPQIRVAAGGQEIVSRDAVLGIATRWLAPSGGQTVAFADVQVTIGGDRATADVYCTAKLATRDARTGEPSIDAREVAIGFMKRDGIWLVSSARTEETLAR